jgi:hypothetical protein
MWEHYFTPESKKSNMEWCHKGCPPPKQIKTQLSAGKIMASVFWDSEGVICVYFLPHGVTVTCFTMMYTKQLGRPGKLSQKKHSFTHGKFDQGDTGNYKMGNH